MLLSRALDERFESLRLSGRVAKWYSAIGNEGITVPAGLALDQRDVLVTLHRDLGAILGVYLDPARTFPGLGLPAEAQKPEPEAILERLARQLLGRAGGFSEGIERSYHYGYFDEAAGIQHIGMISHLGSMIPVTAGAAFARQREGNGGIAINFIGEGGTSTGDFHEALNIASVWKLPMVLVVENNQFAFSTPAAAQFSCERLSDRALGYGMAGETIDGNDPERMQTAVEAAVRRAREGRGPTLLEAVVGRMRGHAEGDDSLKVVPEEDLERYRAADPVPAYRTRLISGGVLDEAIVRALEERAHELTELALDRALEAPLPDASVARRPVRAAASPDRIAIPTPTSRAPADDSTSYVDAISRALSEAMESDPSVVLMGQDIGAFEGAFRVTRGLHQRWPERVRDTPIAESGTLGLAAGAALLGLKPIVEMQFADFVSCGFNQIVNVMAKLYYRFERPCPVVIRLPSGGGVGAGAFHSQNPEGWFAHTAGLEVVCPATAVDAWSLMHAAIQSPNPVIFCEHKYLYRRIKEVLPMEWEPEVLGRAAVRRPGSDLTLVGYGASVWTCIDVAEALSEAGVAEAEVVDLRTLVPLDEETLLESVKKTGRAIVVHEAQRTGGFGAEIAARIADSAFAWLDAPVKRVAYADRPVPYLKVLEKELLPDVDRVTAVAREVLAF